MGCAKRGRIFTPVVNGRGSGSHDLRRLRSLWVFKSSDLLRLHSCPDGSSTRKESRRTGSVGNHVSPKYYAGFQPYHADRKFSQSSDISDTIPKSSPME